MNYPLFRDYGKIVIRKPLYSYLTLFDENNNTKNLNDVIVCLLNDPAFIEGIYWSSPQLYQAATKYKSGELKVEKESKLMRTLMKYAIRASTRCTPYGIFAGSAVKDIGIENDGCKEKMERKVRIDLGLLTQIKNKIESDPCVWPKLRYSVNNSLYLIPGQYRFIESLVENGKIKYQISSIDQTQFLDKILSLAKNKTVSIEDIHSRVKTEFGFEEIKEFVQELIKNQFLISELQLGVTTENEIERIKKILEKLKDEKVLGVNKYITLLSAIENILKKFESIKIGELPLQEITGLELLLDECGIEDRQEHLFQADLKTAIPATFFFTKHKLNELEKSIVILGKLTQNSSPHEIQIENFKKKFSEKYETQEITLAEALDPEFGIGFPVTKSIGDVFHNSLIEKIDTGSKKEITGKIDNWLADKIEIADPEIIKQGIQIHENDLKDFDDKIEQLANTFSVMGTFLPNGKIFLQSVGGAHANSLLGRFAYLEKKMQDLCETISDKEKQKYGDVVFAEIVHIPEGRIGNIARRPILSEYEIPLLASSGLPVDKQLPIEDLMVSVQQNEIVVRSKKLNKRVIPRLSNAHNYSRSTIPAYQFLCAIQHQGKSGFEINMGGIFNNKKHYLPRLYFKNIILHRACWYLFEKDIKTIASSENPIEKLKLYITNWSTPKFVCFAQGDNELFIDTTNDSYLQLLLEEVRKSKIVKLVEWLHCEDENFRENPDIIQFILPLSKIFPNLIPPLEKRSVALNSVQRTFIPGSEWIYFKIYCGAQLSDEILLRLIKPSILSLLKQGIISNAFFIRYTDPHYHIRFRLHLSGDANKKNLEIALNHLYNLLYPYSENRFVWKVQLDTYQREIERYGEEYILASEDAFFHDSMLYLSCAECPKFADDQMIRFFASLKNMDQWLNLFEMSLEEKAAFCMEMAEAFRKEMGSHLKPQIDIKYREWKAQASCFLQSNEYDAEFVKRLKNLKALNLPQENISSYIHLSMNRWFVNRQRTMEYMAYIFCGKSYNELLHKGNKC